MEGNIVTKAGVMPISRALREGIINLDDLSGPEFRQIKGKLKNVRDDVLFDSVRFKAAGAVPQGAVTLFSIPVGQGTALINDAALPYTKDESDTNMHGQGGLLGSGDQMVITSIQAVVACSANAFTTGPAALTVDTTPVALAVNTSHGATNTVLGLTQNCRLRFRVDDARDYENGTLDFFPAEFGVTGFAGSQQEGVAQNGGLKARYLSRVRHLKSQQRFAVILEFTRPITTAAAGRIKIGLVGTKFTPVG
jgi:hypothetical protein